MKAEDTVKNFFLPAIEQAEVSFKAGVKEAVDYFFYDVGIVALMGCSTMDECKAKLPSWQAKLKEWGIYTEYSGMTNQKRLGYTGIEYAVNPDGSRGRSWNFYVGCLHKPMGICPVPNCWAETMWKRHIGAEMKKGKTILDFHHPHLIPELLLAPLKIRKPSTILVNFMGDLFGDWVNPEMPVSITFPDGQEFYTLKEVVLEVIKRCPQHRFLFVTKAPQNIMSHSKSFPDNAWVGVSVCNQKMVNEAIACLAGIDAKHKWLSFEPLLEEIIVEPIDLEGISWVVIGQKTPASKETNPKVEWVKEIIDACDNANIPVFLKNNLIPILPEETRRKIWGQVVLRQEFPEEIESGRRDQNETCR